jgi:glucose/arabinose dehydrogenase
MPTLPRARGGGSLAAALRTCLVSAVVFAAAARPSPGAIYSVAGISETAVVQNLSSPTDFDWLPDGRMLVLEKGGLVKIVVGGAVLATPALNWTANVDTFSERGLLGVCIDPDFATNGYVYLYYTTPSPKNRISRFQMVGNALDPTSETVILDNIDATNGNHNGGTIRIGPDGKLWAAPGDSGTGGSKAQDVSTGKYNGKVLRMELDGSPAVGNPYLGSFSIEERIWAYGFRNPFRFNFRPNGTLFVADVGESAHEELDAIATPASTPAGAGGGNYGWPCTEGSFGHAPPAGVTCTPPLLPPVYDYDHGVGSTIIAGVFVPSAAYPAVLQNKFLVGDYSNNWIRFLDINASNMVNGTLQNLATNAGGPTAFHTGPDGLVYYAAYNAGRVYRINPPGSNFHTAAPCRTIDTRNANGPYGGPAFTANTTRNFHLAGRCGVSAGARAIAVNVTVTTPGAAGDFRIYAAQTPLPVSSVINFKAGQTRANNAVLALNPTGDVSVRLDAPSGAAHLLLDVFGYYE